MEMGGGSGEEGSWDVESQKRGRDVIHSPAGKPNLLASRPAELMLASHGEEFGPASGLLTAVASQVRNCCAASVRRLRVVQKRWCGDWRRGNKSGAVDAARFGVIPLTHKSVFGSDAGSN